MYTAYFGLREQPFNVTPDPRFFYATPGHEEVYANLLYGIRERKGFIALVSEPGTGKTTLLYRIMRELEPAVHTAFFYNTNLTFDELLDFVCSDFGLQTQAGRRLEKIQALNQFLLTRLEEGGTAVLIIDEAHNLADDVWENLRLLSNFETASKKLLQIVLVGQPELAKKLGRPESRQLKQRIAIYCRLDRLKVQAVGPFIDHRLRVAGCTRQDLFTPEAIRRIAVYSDGIPRLINTICDNALRIAYGTAQQTIGETIIEEVADDLLLRREEPQVAYEKPSEEEALRNAQIAYRERGLPDRTDAVGTADRGVTTTPQNGLEEVPQAPAAEISRSWSRRLTWVGIAISIVLLLRVGSVLIFPQQMRARIADPSSIDSRAPIEQERDKPGGQASPPITPDPSARPTRDEPGVQESSPIILSPSSLPPTEQHPESPKAETPEPLSPTQSTDFSEEKWQGQSVTITRGDTITAIVFKVYGNYNVLAFDLIKEFNPHIADLDRIAVGEQVWLPFLTRETLLRKQADGSYHLIIGSFHREGEAERVARTARRQGYAVTITQRRMSGTHLLHRVEIEQLQDLAAVDRAWSMVVQGKT